MTAIATEKTARTPDLRADAATRPPAQKNRRPARKPTREVTVKAPNPVTFGKTTRHDVRYDFPREGGQAGDWKWGGIYVPQQALKDAGIDPANPPAGAIVTLTFVVEA